MMSETRPKENADCLGCRLVSGFGLIGASIYIGVQASRQKDDLLKQTAAKSLRWSQKTGPLAMQLIAASVAAVGTARLLNIYPFNVTHKSWSES